jgi:hypothetical protein
MERKIKRKRREKEANKTKGRRDKQISHLCLNADSSRAPEPLRAPMEALQASSFVTEMIPRCLPCDTIPARRKFHLVYPWVKLLLKGRM